MKPQKLRISAWGPYRDETILDFEKLGEHGLYLITGPTGSGKTTLFDAISFALFGDLSGIVRDKDKVRSDFADVDTKTFVQLSFLHHQKTYTIIRNPRYIRPKKRGDGFMTESENAILTLPDGKVLEGLALVNEKMESLLGMNHMQFKQISMIAQGEFQRLLLASSKERTEIFRTIFKTQIYENLQFLLSRQVKELKGQILERKNKIEEALSGSMVESEEFKDLQDQEFHSYDKLTQLLKEALELDQSQEKTMAVEINQLEESLKVAVQTIHSAKANQEKLIELQLAGERMKQLEEQEEEILQLTEQSERSKRASRVRPVQKEYSLVFERLEELKSESEKIGKEMEYLKDSFLELKQGFEKKEEREAVLDEKKAKAQQYIQWGAILKEIETVTKEREGKEQAFLLLQEKKEEQEVALKLKEEVLQESKERILVQQNLESEREALIATIDSKKKELERYRMLLQSGKELQELHTKLLQAQKKYLELDVIAKEKKKEYEYHDDCYKKAAAGILAKELREGEPCPVCGSKEHPKKAELTDSILKEEEIAVLKEEVDRFADQVLKAQQEAAQLHGIVKGKEAHISQELSLLQLATLNEGTKTYPGMQKEYEELLRKERIIGEKISNRDKQREQAEKLENEIVEQRKKLEEEIAAATVVLSEIAKLEGSIEAAMSSLPTDPLTNRKYTKEALENLQKENEQRYREEKYSYDKLISDYQSAYAKLESKKSLQEQNNQELFRTKEIYAEKRKQYKEALSEHGFQKVEDYASSLLEEKVLVEYEKKIQSFLENRKSSQDHFQRLQEECKEIKPTDLALLEENLKRIEETKASAQRKKEQLVMRISANARVLLSMQEKLTQMQELEATYGKVSELERTAKGDNAYRLVFEQYVLASYFDEILEAANLRLLKMSLGRFELERVKQVNDARTKSSLDIEVLDHYTGKLRHVSTLSGGESFKAALSLALGMSDRIQSYAGGVEVDALFIDEGFGALDSESLDQAMNTLLSLAGENNIIGIISHVSELKERIEKKIVIEKTNVGSFISQV